MFDDNDYKNAVGFALNYPPKYDIAKYDIHKDIFKVDIFDDGWYRFNLSGFFVRSCLKYKGLKKWQNY